MHGQDPSHRPSPSAETGGGLEVAGPAGESLPPAAGQVPVPAWSTPGAGEGAGAGETTDA